MSDARLDDAAITWYELREYAPFHEILSACRSAGAVTPSMYGRAEIFHVRVFHGGLAPSAPQGVPYSWTAGQLMIHWSNHLA
jgi:hypothetical protein